MIYITGDCHADFRKFSSKRFKAQKEMTHEDYLIVCGDFGGVWKDDERERYWLNWLSQKPFTLLFVDGNHENFDRLYSGEFAEVDFHGGRAHKIRDNIYHLMRGHVFSLCGKTFFAFGGAASHDIADGILDRADFTSERAFKITYHNMQRARKLFRVNHRSWWAEELPSREEMERGRMRLKEYGNRCRLCDHPLSAIYAGLSFPGCGSGSHEYILRRPDAKRTANADVVLRPLSYGSAAYEPIPRVI